MIDLTESINEALAIPTQCTPERVKATLNRISAHNHMWNVDWDDLAGEAWGVVLSPEETVALVCSKLPLVLIKEAVLAGISESLSGKELVVVPVQDFGVKQFIVERGKIEEVFGVRGTDIDSGESPFSINDLWYCTV
jgi:hypothetical protein